MPTDEAAALARVCAGEADIREQLERTGEVAVLDRLLEAVRSDGSRREHLDELHLAVQRAGDALGVYGPPRGPGFRPVGMGAARPAEVVFLCPRGDCSRTWRPEPEAAPARCAVYGEPLAWKQL